MEEGSIGEFARRFRLSLKATRRFDELVALGPSRVHAWAQEHRDDRLTVTPQVLGLRTSYLATGPSDPGVDLAVALASKR